MTHKRIKKFSLSTNFVVVATFLLFYSLVSYGENKNVGQVATGSTESDLRGVFYGTVDDQNSTLVGKVGLALIKPTGTKQVPLDYAFNSGDKFRFLVSSNHDGFLYILHWSSDNNLSQLWPNPESNDHFSIKSIQTYTVPPSPGVFIFDNEIGEEQFYIAVRSEPKVPEPGVLDEIVDKVEKTIAAPDIGEKPGTNSVEWVIRGDPFGEGSKRGVIFDPGTKDSDPYRYFSAAPDDSSTKAMVQIMLKHRE